VEGLYPSQPNGQPPLIAGTVRGIPQPSQQFFFRQPRFDLSRGAHRLQPTFGFTFALDLPVNSSFKISQLTFANLFPLTKGGAGGCPVLCIFQSPIGNRKS